MAFDEGLAERLRDALEDQVVVEKRMFGGLAMMVRGHMAVGVVGDTLMVRVGKDAYQDALGQPHARPMDFTGKPLRGFVYVAPEGFAEDEDLRRWVARGVGHALSLPPK